MEMGEDLSSLEWRRSRSISRFICLFNLSLERSISLDDVVELDRVISMAWSVLIDILLELVSIGL